MKFRDEMLEEKICRECGALLDNLEDHVNRKGHKTYLLKPYIRRTYE